MTTTHGGIYLGSSCWAHLEKTRWDSSGKATCISLQNAPSFAMCRRDPLAAHHETTRPCAHHCNYLETQEMWTSLQEILAALRPPSLQPYNHSREDLLFFWKNLVVYEDQEFAAAPAA
jgi:hypothetical protein